MLALHSQAQSIKAYFNHSVDHTVSSITDANFSSHLEDTIVALINSSNNTLEIAVWDNGSSAIVNAINAAHNRGVAVRYITSSNALNSALGSLNSAIPVLERNSGVSSNVMHNKFIIVDQHTILSGSMNFGIGSMVDDYNNIVIIENTNLANNYLIEFNEMWGASTGPANTTLSKFGPDKSDNTTHAFTVGSTPVSLYFSPSDQTTLHIIEAIDAADVTLDVALFTFINNDLGDAVVAAKNRGVAVRAIIENVNYIGSEYNTLVNAGIPTLSHSNVNFDFHHKYALIDAHTASSDPSVVTGSHNWTNSAEDEYDENTLIIHDAVIAGQYAEEFQERINDLTAAGMTENIEGLLQFQVDINKQRIWIASQTADLQTASVYQLPGSLCQQNTLSDAVDYIDISSLQTGAYFLRVVCANGHVETHRFVK
jgi:phosphatidylserine/phosphatidylglycerophosphate/cardiolipin synthase-like enzyme